MWTAKNRRGYDRSKLRYPSDLTNEEWARVEPLIPGAKTGGNKRRINVRDSKSDNFCADGEATTLWTDATGKFAHTQTGPSCLFSWPPSHKILIAPISKPPFAGFQWGEERDY
jgi:hypothetical protein